MSIADGFQLVVRVVITVMICGVAFFCLKRTWSGRIDFQKFLAAPAEAIPLQPEPPQVSINFAFSSTGLNYAPGTDVDGVPWRATMRRHLFVFSNLSADVPLTDLTLDIDLPCGIVFFVIDNQRGCQDLVASQRHSEFALSRGGKPAVPVKTFRNDLQVSCARLAADSDFTLRLITDDPAAIHDTGSLILTYSVPSKDGHSRVERGYTVQARGELPRALSVGPTSAAPKEIRMGISFGPPDSAVKKAP